MKYSLVLIVLLFIASCDLDEAPIPYFLSFESIAIETAGGSFPSTERITDLWIYINQELIGVYPPQAIVPILEENEFELEILPGIRQNGINEDVRLYPFYSPFTTVLSPKVGETDPILLSFSYKNQISCPYFDTFNGANQFGQDVDGDPNTSATLSTDFALDGNALQMQVTQTTPLLEVAQNIPIRDIPFDGSPVFLELDFRGIGTGVFIGLIGTDRLGNSAKQFKLFLFANDQWTKHYIDLSPEITASQFENYQLVFRVIWDDVDASPDQYAVLDNLKLLHF